eukprot:gnl/MRDRNA2_/MRDRNA2_107596_c0_seq1.p1 gnl/MRDRNA2_/MRDRNA2_107596_c0~~gnl/MRDRNA2_/MRDRNA2_107596_c0_seq1.p1  ORF type:complete len:490 (-),score=102.01 gnl/MRDRNA2_/MRDRNA2_107596_c0_seq1:215-1684(-)
MGTPSLELDAVLTRRLLKSEPDLISVHDSSITAQLRKAASPVRRRSEIRQEISEAKRLAAKISDWLEGASIQEVAASLADQNVSLQLELEKQRKLHEDFMQQMKQHNKERDEETQQQMQDLRRTLEGLQARIEYDLDFDMLNDMPREKAIRVCELIESLERERSAIRDGDERNVGMREPVVDTPRRNNINRSDSFQLVGAPTPEREKIWATQNANLQIFADADQDVDQSETQKHRCEVDSKEAGGCIGAHEESSEDDDEDGASKGPAFKLMFFSQPFPTLRVAARPGRDADLKDVVKLTRAITQVLDRTDIDDFVAIYDIQDLRAPSTPVVLEIANWCRVNEHRFKRRLRAASIILADTLWTKAVSTCVWAVTCIAPPVCPFQMCASVEEADIFLREQIEALQKRRQAKVQRALEKEERRQKRREKSRARSSSKSKRMMTDEPEPEDEDEGCSSIGGSRRGSHASIMASPVDSRRGSNGSLPPAPEFPF